MSDKNGKSKLSKIFKGVAIGAGTAGLAAWILPFIPVCAPVIIIGSLIGGGIAAANDDDKKGPKNG